MKINGKRLLIKLSGEMLSAPGKTLDSDKIDAVGAALCQLVKKGYQLGVVVGGGNIIRGRSSGEMSRTDADNMGMLATVINGIALKDAVIRAGAKAVVMSSFEMIKVCETFTARDAIARIEDGQVVIFSGGTGCPYLSTDTAAALRALEIDADVLLCGKACDGVYDKDPNQYADAVKFDQISYDEVLDRRLEALDQAAVILCRDRKLPVFVFKLTGPESLLHAVNGDCDGTVIKD